MILQNWHKLKVFQLEAIIVSLKMTTPSIAADQGFQIEYLTQAESLNLLIWENVLMFALGGKGLTSS